MRRTPHRASSLSHSADTPHEHRKAPRTAHDSIVEIHDGDGRVITEVGRLSNFSITGMCFSTRRALDCGAKIHAELRLLKEGRLQVSGRIVWIKRKLSHYLYGVEFYTLQPIHE